MKKLIFLFAIIFSGLAFGQIDYDADISQNKSFRKENLELITRMGADADVFRKYDKVVDEFEVMRKNLMSIDNLSNKQLQHLFVRPMADKYSDYFNRDIDGKTITVLKYGFKDRAKMEDWLKLEEVIMLQNIIGKELNDIDVLEAKRQEIINTNLKRLGISRKDWDAMSDNDRKLLLQKFE